MPDETDSQLSPRQIECLRLAAAGMTSAEIALELCISPRTVDEYIADACRRLGVRNRVQAVVKAVAQIVSLQYGDFVLD